jgi:uncharacterized protein (DUF433 family)
MAAKRIVSKPDIMFGKPCFEGTRIPVDLVVELVAAGQPMETILEGYPRLTTEDVQAALLYAAESVRWEIAHPSAGR